jgi:ubiquinone biosynthesis O-methyltransferase
MSYRFVARSGRSLSTAVIGGVRRNVCTSTTAQSSCVSVQQEGRNRNHCLGYQRMSRRDLSTTNDSASVNWDEVSKFSAVGKDWWDRSSASGTGPLHAMNICRVDYIRETLATHLNRHHIFYSKQLQGLKVLDVGCGGGLLSEALARLGADVTAIDPSAQNIEVASNHSANDPLTAAIQYRQSTIEEIVKSGDKFDVVCSLEVVEHVENPAQFIADCCRCVLDHGSLFLSTLNRTHKSYALAILGAEYVTKLVPVGTHDWNKFITPEELSVMVQSSADMSVIQTRGMILDHKALLPPAKRMSWKLSDSDLDVNYILHAAKLPQIIRTS